LQPTWIVHLAAISSVGLAEASPELTMNMNVSATLELLRQARDLSPGTRFLITSSADIYGQGSSIPIAELPLSHAKPRSVYARSKWEMERGIEKDFLDTVVRVRPFPHIGPGQGRGFVTADFASQIAAIEAGLQKPTLQVGNLFTQRDFTDVRDVVRAYALLMDEKYVGDVFHVARGCAVSIQSVLDYFLQQARVPISVKVHDARLRPSDTPVVVGDSTKLQRLTGWQAQIPLMTSLADILDDWRQKVVQEKK
jgi:GDP-4-dehydro-6-deoxy-D-mannose reductase